MTPIFDTKAPVTGAEIIGELRRLHDEGDAYLRSLPADIFARPQGEKWSPADHVRHLAKSSRPVGMALGLPRFVLRLRFGRAKDPSRALSVLREAYLVRLAEGVTAGRFTPTPRAIPVDGATDREKMLAEWNAADENLARRMAAWSEQDLDHYVLPHPALGRLTVREMLLFTLYHNSHHLNLVASRVP